MGRKLQEGANARRKALGLVGIMVEVSPEERQRLRAASALAGYKSMKDFCRAVMVEKVAEVYRERGVKE